jgi:hypothetical protein
MRKPQGRSQAGHECQVIELRLMRAHDLFEMPQTDVLSEYHDFFTGVDFCISELSGCRSRRPVRLEISLPPEEIDDRVAERLARSLRRYCDQRIRYDRREIRSQRLGGVSALRIGIPVSALGLVLTVVATTFRPSGGPANLVTDHIGWVLAWIGLWFPIDQFLFYPLAIGWESRVLRRLSDAAIVVLPRRPGIGTEGG